MNTLLGGGADCGPVNPLAQLSKAYGQDRSLQQDHYQPQAGPSNPSFRRAGPSNGNPSDATQFFQQSHPSHSPQPFDLAPLHRALPAGSSQAGPAVPAWAQAFQSSSPAPLGVAADNEAFRQAFGGSPQQQQSGAAPAWSSDFMMHQQRVDSPSISMQQKHQQQQQQHSQAGQYQSGQYARQTGMGGMSMMLRPIAGHSMPAYQQQQPIQQQQQQQQHGEQSQDWEAAFSSLSSDHTMDVQRPAQLPPSPTLKPAETTAEAHTDLSRTAAALLNTVQQTGSQVGNETTDKFAKSDFLGLMRQLRDGETVVEGGRMVHTGREGVTREEEGRVNGMGMESQRSHLFANQSGMQQSRQPQMVYDEMSSVWAEEDAVRAQREGKGKGKARQHFQGDGGNLQDDSDDGVEDGSFLLRQAGERSQRDMAMDMSVPLASSAWDEDFDASMISGGHAQVSEAARLKEKQRGPSAQQQEWHKLQDDWDQFEATTTGIAQVGAEASTTTAEPMTEAETAAGLYTFTTNNPYTAMSRAHGAESQQSAAMRTTLDSVLEHEAAVQRSPNSSAAWLALGIKQQENEREELAIRALTRALELDPDCGEAYLALAVSFTNENERGKAYESVDRWVNTLSGGRYSKEVDAYRDLYGPLPAPEGMGHARRHEYLTGLLIRLARGGGADVDADVQIALGILFNTSEEYEKASDCFGAALSVRPDDPLLFNRLGATLANSGKTDLSIQYYIEALELHPAYVRARFNLAVANMNLGQYEQAVEQLMTSLSIQEEELSYQDGDGKPQENGVTSQTLWDSLNIALLMMHRGDLAAHTINRNLGALRENFPPAF